MKIGIDNALGMADEVVRLRAARTNLLASNLANSDTPGFKAQDIDFQSVLSNTLDRQGGAMADRLQPQRTHTSHLNDPSVHILEGEKMYRTPLMPSLDGNTVDTQMEQAEFAQNTMQFLAGFRILNGRITGMLTAIKGE